MKLFLVEMDPSDCQLPLRKENTEWVTGIPENRLKSHGQDQVLSSYLLTFKSTEVFVFTSSFKRLILEI